MRLGVAFNQRPEATPRESSKLSVANDPPSTSDQYAEWDEPATITAVEGALRVFGDVVLLEAVGDFATRLADARIDLLFNMAEGFAGPSREAHVPAIAEFLGVQYTGSDPLTLALALHKGRAKEIVAGRGIPTAPFVLVESRGDFAALRSARIYPAFLKPAWEGSSKGISQDNYVTTPERAVELARYLLDTYRQPVLAESYLPGDEFTVAVLGNGAEARCLPIVRYRFDQLPTGALPIMGREAKWDWDVPGSRLDVLECPAAISPALTRRVHDVALATYRALHCRDWARVQVS